MLKGNKNQLKPRLSKKLIKNFMFLITLGSFGTIILALSFLGIYIKKFNDHQIIKNAFEESYELENGPVIASIERIVQSIIQPLFNDLFKIEALYHFISIPDNENDIGEGNACNYQHLEIERTCKFIEEPKQLDLNEILDFGVYKTDKMENSGQIDGDLKKFTKLNRLLKAIYLTSQPNEINIQNIYLIHDSKGLFYQYPGLNSTALSSYPGNRRLDGIHRKYPYDFTYQYLKWFIDAKKIFKHTKNKISISYPYEFDNGILGVTLCIKTLETEKTGESFIFICLSIPIQQLHVKMDVINNEIKGFFFLTRVDTKISFYDSFISTNYFKEYDKAEFNSNDTYFLDELNVYNSRSIDMITRYDCELSSEYYRPQTKYDGYYLKNRVWWNYKVFPICFQNSNDGSNINLINIVHAHQNGFSRTITEKYLVFRSDIIIVPVIVFIIQGIILNIFSQYLIKSTAKNIILPMKNIKKILDNMKKKDPLQEEDTNNEESTTNTTLTTNQNLNSSIVNRESQANKVLMRTKTPVGFNQHNHKFNHNNSLEINNSHDYEMEEFKNENYTSSNTFDIGEMGQNETINDNSSDSNSDNNSEEEEYINIRSRDIQYLFCRLINVRDSLSTVNVDKRKVSKKLLPDMLFATEKFEQMKNIPAFNICNSNLGNLLIECKKYDIAIMHLKQSDTLSSSDFREYERRISSDFNRQSFTSKKASSFSGNNEIKKDYISSHESLNIPTDETEKNTKLIESRYPKLIYAFKQFFKTLRALEKIKEKQYSNYNIPSMLISEIEFYSTKKMHFLEEFSKTLDNYLILTNPCVSQVKNKHIYALLEKIDFIIKYELKSSKITKETFKNLKDCIHKAKELIKLNKDINKPKQILQLLIKEETEFDSIDLPNDIIKQRLNYSRGKLALFCSHYLDAIKYFTKIIYKHGIIISDANIIVKSLKKLIFISKIYLNKYESLKKGKEIALLKQFILSKENEIQKFKTVQKYFFIFIDTHNPVNFLKTALEKARHIIDNYIDDNDKYCIAFTDVNDIKILSNLQTKESISNDYFYEFYQNMVQNKHFLQKCSSNCEDNFKVIFQKCKHFMLKKSDSSIKKQIYYVYITNILSYNTIEHLSSNEFINSVNKNEDSIIICLNSNPFEKENVSLYNNFQNNMCKLNKSGIVWMNDLEELRKKFSLYGSVNKKETFSLEKYIP